jgi:hypothetical protein
VGALGAVRTWFTLLKLVVMSNPIGAIVTVIAMGAALIYQHWGKVLELFEMIKGVLGKFKGLLGFGPGKGGTPFVFLHLSGLLS